MNERIKDLAEQAGFSFKYKTAPDELNPGHKLQDLEKLAELIVRECARVADRWVEDEDNGHNLVSERLRQHFGVKE